MRNVRGIGVKKIWKQRYQIIEESGTGGNGKVYKVLDLHLEKEWAMKILDEKNASFLLKNTDNVDELQVLKKISHPNFPRIVDAFEEEERKILIMDYVQGVTLEEVIKKGPMKEREMLVVLKQVCEAILYLHQQTPTLLFLDLKPANIMLEESGGVKLVDLGSVSVKEKAGRISGSLGFASPEQVKVQRDGIFLTEQSDVFSFGMVLYAMVTGSCSRLPIVESGSRFGIGIGKSNPNLSIYLGRILEKCTRGNAARRYAGMREIKRELEHWEEGLKKKRWGFKNPLFYNREKKRWYQEKSIFCTEGKHSFYIAKKILILIIGMLCLVQGKVSMADEQPNRLPITKVQREISDKTTESLESKKKEEKMEVIIRDGRLRKVLIKENCAYETASNILLEIPWNEIEGKECRILVECEDESQEKKHFFLECIYVK